GARSRARRPPRKGNGRGVLGLGRQAESLLERRLGPGSDRRGGRLALLEEDDGGDRLHPVAGCQRRLLVDVHLHELEVAVVLLDDAVEHRSDGVAGATPFGQKSTITGLSLWRTSSSKLCSVTAVAMGPF